MSTSMRMVMSTSSFAMPNELLSLDGRVVSGRLQEKKYEGGKHSLSQVDEDSLSMYAVATQISYRRKQKQSRGKLFNYARTLA